MVDRLRTIDPREVQRDFSCDIFIDRELRNQFIVNGNIGLGFSGTRKGRVDAVVICDRSKNIERGRISKHKDAIQKEGIGTLIIPLSPTAERNIFIGDDLELRIDGIVEIGAYLTISSTKMLAVEKLAPNENLREIIENKSAAR